MRPHLKLTFDGGCNPNPGFGYGSYDFDGTWPFLALRAKFGDGHTNNTAEFTCLLRALWEIERLKLSEPDRPVVDIWSDSKLLVESVGGLWLLHDKRLKQLRDEVLVALAKVTHQWTIHWHSRDNSMRLFGH